MRLLLWIVRALAILLLLRFILQLLFGRRRVPSKQPGAASPAGPRERSLGELVRDPNCGTYIPKSRAIASQSGGETLYFCSTKCRDEYGNK